MSRTRHDNPAPRAGRRNPFRGMRVTARGIVVFLGAAVLVFAARALAIEVPMACALALLGAHVAGCAQLVAYRLLTDHHPSRPGERAPRAFDLIRALIEPNTYLLDTAWERLDQTGRVIEVLAPHEVPAGRGWWRLPAGTLRRRDCFGLWCLHERAEHDRELVVPPEVARTRSSGSGQVGGGTWRERTVEASQVRPYEKGDPLRTISWRQTAHHGELMSFEEQPAEAPAALVVVDTISCRDADALAAAALRAYLTSRRRGTDQPTRMTDGEHIMADERAVLRFVAALEGEEVPEDAAVDAAHDRARQVGAFASEGTRGSSRVLLVTQEPHGTLAHALGTALRRDEMVVLAAPVNARDDTRAASEEASDADADGHDPANTTRKKARRARRGAGARPHARTTKCVHDLVAAAACVCALLVSLQVATALVEPAQWYALARVTFVVAGLAGTLASWLPGGRRRAVRAGVITVVALGIMAAAITQTTSMVAAATGIDVLREPERVHELGQWAAMAPGPLSGIVAQGLGDLYIAQWVPLTLEDPLGDAALTLVVGGLAAVCVLMLSTASILRPLVAFLPLAVMATQALCLGTPAPAGALAASLVCLLVLMALDAWLLDGEAPAAADALDTARLRMRRRDRATRAPRILRRASTGAVLISCLVALVAQALAPGALRSCQTIPLELDLTPGLLSSTTVSPIVDLRRDLMRGEETVAATYTTTARHPLYLKLATLDDFNGDAWFLDSSLGTGGLSGIPLIGTLLVSDAATPARVPALPGSAIDGTNLMFAASTVGIPPVEDVMSEVTIDNLSSRFAPAPAGAYASWTATLAEALDEARRGGTADATDAGDTGDWSWSGDGVIYGTASSTTRGQTYTVRSAYIEPVHTVDELDAFDNLPEALLETLTQVSTGGASSIYEEGPEHVDPRFLSVPDELPAHMTAVIEAAQAAGIPARARTYTEELRALAYLVTCFTDGGFTYTLDAPDGDGRDTLDVIDTFLERKSGYCIHYASSLALLARSLGVPTRMVVGYRTNTDALTETDGTTSTYTVTNHNLHAWVEAYLFGVGWIPLDVTPGSGGTSGAGTSPTTPDEPEATTPEDPATQDTPQDITPDVPDEAAPDGSGGQQGADALLEALGAFAETAARAAARVAPVALIILIAALPALIRHHRRTRRLRTLERGAGRDAIEAAWAEVIDRALDRGAPLTTTMTEQDQARVIGERLAWAAPAERGGRHTDDAARRPADGPQDGAAVLDVLASAVCAARYSDETDTLPPHEEIARAFHTVNNALARNREDLAQPPTPRSEAYGPAPRNGAAADIIRAAGRLRCVVLPRSVLRRRR